MENEELMGTLRKEAEEYGEVTKAIQADMGDDINPDALAIYYRAKTTDDQVLRGALENKYGEADLRRFDTYFDGITSAPQGISVQTVADPLADKGSRERYASDTKDPSMLGKVGNVATSVASGAANLALDAPDIVTAAATKATMRRANFFENHMEKLFDATIGRREVDVALTGVTPEHKAWMAERGVEVNEGDTSVRMTMSQRNRLTAEWLTDGKADSQYEMNKLYYDGVVTDKEAKLDGGVSEMAYHLTDWGIEFAGFPGYAKLGRWGFAASALLRGAAADNVVFQEGDETMIMMAEELGLPELDFLDIIRTDDDKAGWENRLAVTIEGAGLGIATDSVFAVVGAMRKVHRGGDAGEAVAEANEIIGRNLAEAKEARQFTADEINNAKAAVKDVEAPAPVAAETVADVPTTAADLLVPEVRASQVKLDADKAMDTLVEVDLDDFTDANIESLSGIRKFSEWSNWDDVAGARIAINEHLTGLFDSARAGDTMDNMIAKTEAVRKKQLKDGSPDWANMTITDETTAKAYINNMIVEKTLSGQLAKISDWMNNGSRAAELPEFLSHLENVSPELRKMSIAAYTDALFQSAAVLGKKNQEQISESARTLVSQRWIKAGALKEAEAELATWMKAQKEAGNVEFADLEIGLRRITEAADGSLTGFRNMVKHVAEGAADNASALVRFRNANMLANHKTMAINAISEAVGHTQAGIISRMYQGFTSVLKGRPMDGAARIALGATFAVRQFSQFGKSISNAGRLFSEGIGEVSGSASAFDSAGKGIGKSFDDIFSESGSKFTGTLNVFTAGVNRTIASISEVFSSMAVYQKTQDDALLGAFGEKYRKLAGEGMSLRAMSREEITQMFVDNKHPGLLVRRTRSNNLIDKGAADNAAIIGFREDKEFDGNSDAIIGAVRRAAYQSKATAAAFDFFAPFAKTIVKISRMSLLRGLPAPLWFASKSFRKRFNSSNPAVRQLARAEFALNSMVYTTFLSKGLMDEDAEEDRLEQIASLKQPGDSVVMFEPIDEVIGFGEDFQGWVKVTMQEDGELKTTYVLPQELNIIFSTAVAAQSTGRFIRSAIDNDGTDKSGWGHYMQMAATAGAAGVTQNNLVGNFVESIQRTLEAPSSPKKLAAFLAMNVNSFTPFAPEVKHFSADWNKSFDDGESMQFNSDSWDDIGMKASENFAYGAAFRQLTRMDVHEYLNVKRGPFGSPLPTRGRGVALIAKAADVGQGELLFSDFLQNEIGTDPTRLGVKVVEGGIDLKQIRVANDQHSLGDQILEKLPEITIGGLTINDRMIQEFTDPNSQLAILEDELLASVEHGGPMRDGIARRTSEIMTDREDYLLGVHREYLNASKEEVMYAMDDKTRMQVEERIAQTNSDYDLVDMIYGKYKQLINNNEEGQ